MNTTTAVPAGSELVADAARLAGLLGLWAARPPASEPASVHRRAGGEAVVALDELLRSLYRTRATLVAEIRARDDETAAAVDELLAARGEPAGD